MRGKELRMIHCADLHLDSKMEANLTKEQARERSAEILMTYCQMIDYAKEHDVDVIMIAGDLFDTVRVSKRTLHVVLDSIRTNPEIDFLYLCGNHDNNIFLKEWKEETGSLPSNLKFFDKEWKQYTYDNVVISGVELYDENANSIYDTLVLNPETYNIVMLHGQESKYRGNDKTQVVNLTALKNKNIDYLALGHIHTYKEGILDGRGSYCYSGCLEGRGFDECGQKGFAFLIIKGGELQRTFIPMGKRCLHEIRVSIGGLLTSSEVLYAIEEKIFNIPCKDLIKVILEGGISMEIELDISYLSQILNERFYFAKVLDETTLEVNFEQLRYDVSLKGEFLRLVLADSKLTDREKEQIALLGVRALSGEEVVL